MIEGQNSTQTLQFVLGGSPAFSTFSSGLLPVLRLLLLSWLPRHSAVLATTQQIFIFQQATASEQGQVSQHPLFLMEPISEVQ